MKAVLDQASLFEVLSGELDLLWKSWNLFVSVAVHPGSGPESLRARLPASSLSIPDPSTVGGFDARPPAEHQLFAAPTNAADDGHAATAPTAAVPSASRAPSSRTAAVFPRRHV